MQNLVENKPKSKKNENDEEEKKPRPVIKSATDLQRLKLEKLMKNPDKPVMIPESPREKDYMQTVPSFVRNVMGSSAGAGSGEFHVYRHLRRKEYARQKCIHAKSMREQMDEEYQSKLEKNRLESESKTAKKRAKRLKKKQRSKKPRPPQNEQEKSVTSEEDDDDDDDENPSEKNQGEDKKENSPAKEERSNDGEDTAEANEPGNKMNPNQNPMEKPANSKDDVENEKPSEKNEGQDEKEICPTKEVYANDGEDTAADNNDQAPLSPKMNSTQNLTGNKVLNLEIVDPENKKEETVNSPEEQADEKGKHLESTLVELSQSK